MVAASIGAIALTGSAIACLEGVAFVGPYAGYTAFLALDGLDEPNASIIGALTLAAIVPILAPTVRTLTIRQRPPNQQGGASRP